MHVDHIHYIGSPGGIAGYSGGPVVSKSDFLYGILLGGIHQLNSKNTVEKIMGAIGEQDYVQLLPIGIAEIMYTSGLSFKVSLNL